MLDNAETDKEIPIKIIHHNLYPKGDIPPMVPSDGEEEDDTDEAPDDTMEQTSSKRKFAPVKATRRTSIKNPRLESKVRFTTNNTSGLN